MLLPRFLISYPLFFQVTPIELVKTPTKILKATIPAIGRPIPVAANPAAIVNSFPTVVTVTILLSLIHFFNSLESSSIHLFILM